MEPQKVKQESLFIPLPTGDQLHLRHIFPEKGDLKAPVFLTHGAIGNGKIFYTLDNRGFGPYLAEQGYDVYVGDLRGRGESRPAISRKSDYGQISSICEDIPAFLDAISQRRPQAMQLWGGHSWGGVLIMSFLARFPQYRERCRGLLFFATKRAIHVSGFQKWLNVDLLWNGLSPLIAQMVGYLPARALGFGADNETIKTHRDCVTWAKPSAWVDPKDGFDYAHAMAQIVKRPPALFISGSHDGYLGHPSDVKVFMEECGYNKEEFWLLDPSGGFKRAYDHTSLLTHPEAIHDHFPKILKWLSLLDS